MISYGGIPLDEPEPGISAWVEQQLALSEIPEWSVPTWPGPRRLLWAATNPNQPPPIKLGRLFWPRDASRWASFYCLVTDYQLASIRKQAYPVSNANQYVSLPLVISEGNTTYQVSTNLWMLPPRPLAQIVTPASQNLDQLYLICLVDDRFFWWEKAAAIAISGGVTTWATLFAAIATGLGITLTTDTISANYVYPSTDLVSNYEYLPPLLDACCASVGHRLVRSLAGVVTTQQATTAATKQAAQVAKWAKQAGGTYLYDVKNPPLAPAGTFPNKYTLPDLPGLVPASVTVAFPAATNGVATGLDYAATVTLASLSLSQFAAYLQNSAIVGHNSTHLVHSSAVANTTAGPGLANATEITNLATQITTDYYLWRLSKLDQAFMGMVPYVPEGLADFVEWLHRDGEGQLRTHVHAGQREDWTDSLNHWGTYAAGGQTFSGPVYFGGNVTYGSNSTVTTVAGSVVNFGGSVTFGGAIYYTETAVTISGNTNNYAIGSTVNYIDASMSGSSYNLTGIAKPSPGASKIVYITNTDATGSLTLKQNSGSSTAGNRFLTPSGSDVVLAPGQTAQLVYSTAEAAWLVLPVGVPASGGTGTVTSITAGTGLTGGTITTTGTIALSTPVIVANGGTGLATLTAHAFVIGEGTSNVALCVPGAAGQMALSQGASADPAFVTMQKDGTLDGSGNLTVTGINGNTITSPVTFTIGATLTLTAVPTWYKLVVTPSTFSAASTTNTVAAFVAPAGTCVLAEKITNQMSGGANFTGTGVTSYSIGIGITGNNTKYIANVNVHTNVSASPGIVSFESDTGTVTFNMTATCNVNLNFAAAAGEAECLWLLSLAQ